MFFKKINMTDIGRDQNLPKHAFEGMNKKKHHRQCICR